MSVLVLHRNALAGHPYERWLGVDRRDIVVVAARAGFELNGEDVTEGDAGFGQLVVVDDDTEDALRSAADRVARHRRIDRVVALKEGDLLVAAQLRERWGVPGDVTEDLVPYRDKAVMKDRADRAGVAVAPYLVLPAEITPAHTGTLHAFAARHGYPLVAKSRRGYGSIGLQILGDAAAVDALAADPVRRTARDGWLVEAFVAGRMCHVDGVVRDRRLVLAWPSQYQYDLSSFATDPGPRIDLTLDPTDPLTPVLLELTQRVVDAVSGTGTMTDHVVHAEFFTPAGTDPVLCEVAARPGGARVRDVVRLLFDVDVAACAARAQCRLPLPALPRPAPGQHRPAPATMAAQVTLMKRPGVVEAVPTAPDESWVAEHTVLVRPGQRVAAASRSADFLASAVVTGPSRTVAEDRARLVAHRWQRQLVMRPDVVAVGGAGGP